MSIERFERSSFTTFATWCAAHLVKGGEHAQNYYFKYMEFYSYAGTMYGIDFYRDEPIFTLIEDETAPTNWSTNYNDYYTKEGNDYIKNDFESEPEWEADVYYSRTAPTEKALRIGRQQGSDQYTYIAAYKNSSTGESFTTSSTYLLSEVTFLMLKCDGGILIRFTCSQYWMELLLAKTNHGETACVFNGLIGASSPNTDKYKTDVHSVTWGDYTTSEKKLTFTTQEQFQTQLVPFTTYAPYESISYTPTAFYCPISSVYALRNHTVVYDDEYYVTNGYWMIKDELPNVPSLETA